MAPRSMLQVHPLAIEMVWIGRNLLFLFVASLRGGTVVWVNWARIERVEFLADRLIFLGKHSFKLGVSWGEKEFRKDMDYYNFRDSLKLCSATPPESFQHRLYAQFFFLRFLHDSRIDATSIESAVIHWSSQRVESLYYKPSLSLSGREAQNLSIVTHTSMMLQYEFWEFYSMYFFLSAPLLY